MQITSKNRGVYKVKNKILEYNNKLVLSEMKNLTGIIIGITKDKNAHILILGMINYIILFSVEAVRYIEENEKIEILYKYKKQLNNSRAIIKESDKDWNGMIEDMKKINAKTYKEYYEKSSKFAKKYFSFLITNLGIYFYRNNIIGNTFLYKKNNKKIFLTDKMYDKNKIMSVGIELGTMLKNILIRYNEKEKENFNNISNVINKFSLLYNKNFRNNMFHYNFQNDLDEIDENEMYYGLINKQLKMTEEEFKELLNDYINEIHIIINTIIF